MRERKHSLRSLIEWDGADHTNGDGLMQRARKTPSLFWRAFVSPGVEGSVVSGRGVFPNRGFWRQLVAYEEACLGSASYTEQQLPGSIAFDKEKIEAVVSAFRERRRQVGTGGGKRGAEGEEGEAKRARADGA